MCNDLDIVTSPAKHKSIHPEFSPQLITKFLEADVHPA
jgi:hypothetical protein